MTDDRSMSRRESLKGLAALAAGAPMIVRGRYRPFWWTTAEYSARAVRLMEESLVVDLLNQFRFEDFAEKPVKASTWLNRANTFSAADFEPYRQSRIRVIALGHAASSYETAIRWFAAWSGFIAGYGQWFTRIDDAGDFARIARPGQVGIMLTFQNSDHFRGPDDVDEFFGLGQRVSQLTYNFQNRIGSGFLEEKDGGLTIFGQTIVARMEQVGMAVDVSHCADRTTLDTLAAAKKPVIFSHASCRALIPGHLRCKTDEMIKKMAASGGVMGIPFIRFMIKNREPVTIEDVLDHFDYVVKLVGVQHVGVGSDCDIIGNPNPMNAPAAMSPSSQPNFARYQFHTDPDGKLMVGGLDHAMRMFDLTEGLIRRKYTDDDIKLMLGGNWARALGTIWPA